MNNTNDKKSFWATLPGILTGIAAVITAIGSILLLLPVIMGTVPEIDSFNVNTNEIILGESCTLSWSVSDAKTVTIDPDIGIVAKTGTKLVSPEETTTYTLIATRGRESTDASVQVVVSEPVFPVINYFTAEDSTLSWSVSDATSVTINPEIGSVISASSRVISPVETTTYTLTATNEDGSVQAQAVIEVIEKPVINYFTAENSTLSWSVSDAITVTIDQGIGSVRSDDRGVVSPDETTTYTLTATNEDGSVQAQAVVEVIEEPVIKYFTVEDSTLSWSVSDATSVTIDHGIGSVASTGTFSVSPDETTTYTLTATNGEESTTASVQVVVIEPVIPVINYFTANPNNIILGDDSTLSWSVSDAISVTIDPDIGSVGLTGTWSVSPDETTTYTLTATNGEESTDASVQVVVRARTLTLDIENGPVGTVVTVSGSGFTAEGTVNMITINGESCTLIDTILIDIIGQFTGDFVIPSVGNLGIYEITVTDSYGLEANSNFLVTGLAEIVVSPTYGSPGATITVTGSNFAQIAGTEVTLTLWSKDPTPFKVADLGTVDTNADGTFEDTFVSPAVAFTSYEVRAVDEYSIADEDAFKVGLIAMIINPTSGKVGTEISITGIGFAPGVYDLTFGTILYEEFGTVSSTEAISDLFNVPNVEPGVYDITVIDTDENELTVQFTVTD